jgi:hypothetical protein
MRIEGQDRGLTFFPSSGPGALRVFFGEIEMGIYAVEEDGGTVVGSGGVLFHVEGAEVLGAALFLDVGGPFVAASGGCTSTGSGCARTGSAWRRRQTWSTGPIGRARWECRRRLITARSSAPREPLFSRPSPCLKWRTRRATGVPNRMSNEPQSGCFVRILIGIVLPPVVAAMVFSLLFTPLPEDLGACVEEFSLTVLMAFFAGGVQFVVYSLLMEFCVLRFIRVNYAAVLVSSLLGLACGGSIFPGSGEFLLPLLVAGFVSGLVTGLALYRMRRGVGTPAARAAVSPGTNNI